MGALSAFGTWPFCAEFTRRHTEFVISSSGYFLSLSAGFLDALRPVRPGVCNRACSWCRCLACSPLAFSISRRNSHHGLLVKMLPAQCIDPSKYVLRGSYLSRFRGYHDIQAFQGRAMSLAWDGDRADPNFGISTASGVPDFRARLGLIFVDFHSF